MRARAHTNCPKLTRTKHPMCVLNLQARVHRADVFDVEHPRQVLLSASTAWFACGGQHLHSSDLQHASSRVYVVASSNHSMRALCAPKHTTAPVFSSPRTVYIAAPGSIHGACSMAQSIQGTLFGRSQHRSRRHICCTQRAGDACAPRGVPREPACSRILCALCMCCVGVA